MLKFNMMFTLDTDLLDQARAVLAERPFLFWLIGGACTGKSTLARAISDARGIPVYDMDEHVYGTYMPRYTPARHPACTAWFTAPNPLAYVLALDWPAFNALNRATNAEFLDLLADDLAQLPPDQPLLVDGGFTHPSVLVRVAPPHRIACVAVTAQMAAHTWETAPDRAEMRAWIGALVEPEAQWQRFLRYDRLMSETLEVESREHGIEVFWRGEETAVDSLAAAIADHFHL